MGKVSLASVASIARKVQSIQNNEAEERVVRIKENEGAIPAPLNDKAAILHFMEWLREFRKGVDCLMGAFREDGSVDEEAVLTLGLVEHKLKVKMKRNYVRLGRIMATSRTRMANIHNNKVRREREREREGAK